MVSTGLRASSLSPSASWANAGEDVMHAVNEVKSIELASSNVRDM
jgi:hypothetical protein